MQINLIDAMKVVDEFELLLEKYGISIKSHVETKANMLPIWNILNHLRNKNIENPDQYRDLYTAGAAVHDLAAKVIAVADHPNFKQLIPHLKMLNDGAVHLTEDPPANADTYNKLIEIYWACLLMASGVNVELDDPEHSTGKNPDVIALDNCKPARAYAFKTVRSKHTQNLFEHLQKGVEQIEQSAANEGIVCFQLTPRILQENLWNDGKCYIDWQEPAAKAVMLMNKWISQIVIDNKQEVINDVFSEKKAKSVVLCLALFSVVAKNPETGNPIVMPLKVATLVGLESNQQISAAMYREVFFANNLMQTLLD